MRGLRCRLREGFDATMDGAIYVVRRATRLMAAIAILVAVSATSIVIVVGMIDGRVAAQLPFGVSIEVPGIDTVEREAPNSEAHTSHVPQSSSVFANPFYIREFANEICPLVNASPGALPRPVPANAGGHRRNLHGR